MDSEDTRKRNCNARSDIANDLNLPWDEVETLVFGLTGPTPSRPQKPGLSIVT